MLQGEVGIGYLENGNVIAKLGDGVNTWKDLPQIEGVFEDDVILTYNFGKHVIDQTVGFKKVDAKGMTMSEWQPLRYGRAVFLCRKVVLI